MTLTLNALTEALDLLGELLQERGHHCEMAVIGGGALLLQGLHSRTTKDLDAVARLIDQQWDAAAPFPEWLVAAVADVGRVLGIASDWLNPGPSDLITYGLPDGFFGRAQCRQYRALTLHIAARSDQICFKLYAAVDQGPQSKHFQDLQRLGPNRAELEAAARWTKTHDPSQPFAEMLGQCINALLDSDE